MGAGIPPRGPNSFIFMQFSAKNLQNNPTYGVGKSPWENPRSTTVIGVMLKLIDCIDI